MLRHLLLIATLIVTLNFVGGAPLQAAATCGSGDTPHPERQSCAEFVEYSTNGREIYLNFDDQNADSGVSDNYDYGFVYLYRSPEIRCRTANGATGTAAPFSGTIDGASFSVLGGDACAGGDGSSDGPYFPIKDSSGALWSLYIGSGSRSELATYTVQGCRATDTFSPATGCTPEGPEIDVVVDGSSVPDGGSVTGLTGSAGTPITKQVVVKNTGTELLTFTAVTSFINAVNLTNLSFSPVVSSIPAGGQIVATVTGTPTDAGPFSVEVLLHSDDADENPYNITVSGTAVAESPTVGFQQAALSHGSTVMGSTHMRMSEHVASNRMERRFNQNGNGNFTALSTPAINGWTALSSDQFADHMASYEQDRMQSKLDALDPETAALLDGKWGHDKPWNGNGALDIYSAGGYGSLDRDGAGDYEGFARYATLGFDYLLSDDFLFGANLNWEWSEIDYAADINGESHKQGLRLDTYAGWQLSDAVVAEGMVSYAWLENQISANNDKGDTSSERLALMGKLTGSTSVLGATVSPYTSVLWAQEWFDSYTTDAGVAVGKTDTEFSQGVAGFELQSSAVGLYGLSPFVALQGEWDWVNGDTVTLADGSVVKPDDWGASYKIGVRGSLDGFAEGLWLGDLLEGAYVDIDFTNASFGREDKSYVLQWTITRSF